MYCSKYIKLPSAFANPKNLDTTLKLDDLTVIKSFHFTQETIGSVFFEAHTLYFVKSGTSTITYGKVKYEVNENQMLLFNRATMVDYHKKGNEESVFENLFFFLSDDFVSQFVKMTSIKTPQIIEPVLPSVKNVNERLKNYFNSVSEYFTLNQQIEQGLLRLKLMELLYELANTDPNLLHQLLQIHKQVPTDLARVMDTNYLNPISIEELAYLAGRSLASFKRDFAKTYNTSPASWIRKKRLEKAKELLLGTQMSVTDICFSTGFENASHFSRLFKDNFGVTPSSVRNNVTDRFSFVQN